MKKLFSLLLVVAMIASLSVASFAAPANADGGMHTVITETDSDITVDVIIKNVVNCNGITSYIVTDKVSFVEGSTVVASEFAAGTCTPTTNKAGYIKFVLSHTDAANYVTSSDAIVALSYKVAKIDPATELSEADFKYDTSTIKVSKVVTASGGTVAGVAAGNNFTTAKQPAYFTVEYVDARTPVTPDEPVVPDDVILNDETFDEGASSFDVEEGATIKYGDSEITAGANAKVYTFFAKAAEALAADSYGVTATINGKAYKFPGKADVEAGKNWAIRFVVPAGQFSDGIAIDSIDNIVAY